MADLFDMPDTARDSWPTSAGRPAAAEDALSEVIGQEKVLSVDGPLGAMLAAGSLVVA